MKTKEAIEFYGSASAVARALRIRPHAVFQWGEEVPIRRQYELEKLTKGKLKAIPFAAA